ncbi:hypothetical protein POTOM_028357 [Populus tomentosa]|uniref:Uncharacterized protein n=1 Tax=Populus tomentosa TaxID=118781 RepID=A0A8X7ZEB4_POPTO|nr:hypothetical protein POTOM_028357 [Populus tomentosa]
MAPGRKKGANKKKLQLRLGDLFLLKSRVTLLACQVVFVLWIVVLGLLNSTYPVKSSVRIFLSIIPTIICILAKIMRSYSPVMDRFNTRLILCRSSEQNIILENGKLLDHVETTKDATCKTGFFFCRKIDAIRTGTNQPGSPEVKEKPIRTVSIITRSESSPSQPVERWATTITTPNTAARSRVTIKRPNKENDHQNGKQSDHPFAGMSIIIMTLVLMLVWGKLCAILCTSAWFYFVPRLRISEDSVSNGLILAESFYDSEEHKKKVVMDGFLERSRRSIS